ncbi:hypothetical protein BV22DRAFT_1024677, partial [Leucogyrophana mollusca]
TCVCGRAFYQPNMFSTHERSCSRTKKRLSGVLTKAKELWDSGKRRRMFSESVADSESNQDGPPGDILPQKLSALPPPAINSVLPDAEAVFQLTPRTAITSHASDGQPVNANPRPRHIVETTRNVFGLFRHYEGGEVPQHDPKEYVTLTDLSNVSSAPVQHFLSLGSKGSFGPYPNQSSFQLGEWYWNGPSAQKSQASFKELLDIIQEPDFHPADTKGVNWHKLDQQLPDGHSEDGWIDSNNANWERTPITLSVPFPKKSRDPGVL